ncbi:hypothetical protein HDU96_006328 [Phlyctochytrium bullatum]|nr:hypothetical protein HDU96_006328 [Phlyctochytrium bullatum]
MLVDRVSHYNFVEDLRIRRLDASEYARLGRRAPVMDDGRRVLSFRGFNRTFEFDIFPNPDVVAPNLSIDIDGRTLSDVEAKELISEHAVYKGHVRGDSQHGWLRFVFGAGSLDGEPENVVADGIFAVDEGVFQISMVDTYRRAKRDIDTEIASPLSRHPSHARAQMIIISEDMTFAASPDPYTRVLPNFASASNSATCSSSSSVSSSPASSHSSAGSKVCRRSLEVQTGGCGVRYDREGYNLRTARSSLPKFFKPSLWDSFTSTTFENAPNATSNGVTLRRRAAAQCFSSRKWMFMGVAADCNYVKSYGGSSQALQRILSNINTASTTYESAFNVLLAVVKVNIQTACANNTALALVSTGQSIPWNRECVDSYTINERLSDFSYWRGNYPGFQSDNAGLWHLLTGCSSSTSGQAVGVAWLKTTCTTEARKQVATLSTGDTVQEYVSGTGVSSKVTQEWKVVAHEVGHNFGANHDCDQNTCACQSQEQCLCCKCASGPGACDCQGNFLMHPTDNAKTTSFSDCSVNSICTTLQDTSRSACLRDSASLPSISENICGNGVREGNEECDCGDEATCKNDPCCNPQTCKLNPGAVCDDFNDDCCQGCKLKAKDSVCRPSIGPCDYAEVCSGTNKTCPPDLFHPDKEPCGVGNGLACASGQCTSRQLQCQNRVTSINTTGPCPGRDSECALYCAMASGYCTILSGSFLDGTPCGFSGTCKLGTCTNENFLGAALDWFKSNPAIGIPVVVVAGLIVLTLIIGLIRCCCRGCRSRPKRRPEDLPVIPSSPYMVAPRSAPAYPSAAVVTSSPAAAAATGTGQLGTYQQGGSRRSSNPRSTVRPSAPASSASATTSPSVTSPSSAAARNAPSSGATRSNWVDASRYNGF